MVHGLMPDYDPEAQPEAAFISLSFLDFPSEKYGEEKQWCTIELPHGLCAILIKLSVIAYKKRIEKKETTKLLSLLHPGVIPQFRKKQTKASICVPRMFKSHVRPTVR
jgi:hypothetical protein